MRGRRRPIERFRRVIRHVPFNFPDSTSFSIGMHLHKRSQLRN